MSIMIDQDCCTGCKACHKVCPGNLLKGNSQQKTSIRDPFECWGCTACIKECPVQAIKYFLGADIGGRGSLVTSKQEKDRLHWVIERPSGEVKTISINKKEANNY